MNHENCAARAVRVTVGKRAAEPIKFVNKIWMRPFKEDINYGKRLVEFNRVEIFISQIIFVQKFIGDGLSSARTFERINSSGCHVEKLRDGRQIIFANKIFTRQDDEGRPVIDSASVGGRNNRTFAERQRRTFNQAAGNIFLNAGVLADARDFDDKIF